MGVPVTGFDYSAKRDKAEILIARYGQEALLLQDGPLVGPAWAAQPGEPNESSVVIVVIDTKATPAQDGVASRLKKTVMMSVPAYATPARGDTLVIGGVQHEVLEIRPFAPAGEPVFFEMDVVT